MVIFRTPHPSAKEIKIKNRKDIKVMVRHGASKKARELNKKYQFEINSIEAINKNADKMKMKEIFVEKGVSTPECMENTAENRDTFKKNGWNVVFKKRDHKRAIGMELMPINEIDKLADNKYSNGILERRINISREWRVHCCPKLNKFFPLEKRRRNSAKGTAIRNIETCIFAKEFDEQHPQPPNWQEGLDLCKKALEAIGLDTGAIDLALTPQGKWYIIETNSGPGLGNESRAWYQEIYQELVDKLEK